MRTSFPLFQSHLDLAHSYWRQLLKPGDTVIDATCGNGHDSLVLAQLVLQDGQGRLYAIDVQSEAIVATRTLLAKKLPKSTLKDVFFANQSHAHFPSEIAPNSVNLIVYNLGYLPGGSKALTTTVSSTLSSLQQAMMLVKPGGCVSLTAYPGHAEGKIEEQALLKFVAEINPWSWNCCHHVWCNRKEAPSLLVLQKRCA